MSLPELDRASYMRETDIERITFKAVGGRKVTRYAKPGNKRTWKDGMGNWKRSIEPQKKNSTFFRKRLTDSQICVFLLSEFETLTTTEESRDND